MSTIRCFLIIIALIGHIFATPTYGKEGEKPFTVQSAFSRTRLYDVTRYDNIDASRPFLLAKDGSKLFLITGAGIPEKKTYAFKLIMYDINNIKSFVDKTSETPPKPTVIFEAEHDQSINFSVFPNHRAGIRQLNLYDEGRKIAFLATDKDGIFQIFSWDITAGAVHQITKSEQHIGDYIVLDKSSEILYVTAANSPIGSDHCSKPVFNPLDKYLLQALCLPNKISITDWFEFYNKEGPPLNSASLYRVKLGSVGTIDKISDNLPLITSISQIKLSPDQSKGVVKLRLNEVPSHLADAYYRSRQFKKFSGRMHFENDLSVNRPLDYLIYGLIDLSRNEVKYYLELPTGPEMEDGKIVWLSDTHVYLPYVEKLSLPSAVYVEKLSGSKRDGEEVKNGTVIDTETHQYIPLEKFLLTNKIDRSLDETESAQDYQASVMSSFGNCPKTQDDDHDNEEKWRECFIDIPSLNLRIRTGERYNTPPNIIAENILNGKSKILMELNPQFKHLTLGEVQILRIPDESNKEWILGMVLPPSYVPGRRYPLVIQTHGFDLDSFLIDGPPLNTAPYVAQALANKDIIVLQVPNPYERKGSLFADPEIARIIKNAVEVLDKKGLININKIGMTGFSARGRLVMRSAVFKDYELEAIVVADSSSFTPWFHALTYKGGHGGYTQIEKEHCNSQPWGIRQKEWIDRQVFFHLDRINASVLFQEYNRYFPSWWDVIGGLRRLKKAVDAYTFQSGQHPPTQAEEVLLAQEQVVDWYDFWLNDRESNDATKAEQYRLWRSLRLLKKAENRANLEAGTPLSAMDCPRSQYTGR